MDFYFKPRAGSLKDNILRVSPDLLPPGSVRISDVWVDGVRYTDFDALGLTVHLPEPTEAKHPLQLRPAWSGNPMIEDAGNDSLKVRVRLVPVTGTFDVDVDVEGDITILSLTGVIDDVAEPSLRVRFDHIVSTRPKTLVIRAEGLDSLSSLAARALAFGVEKLDLDDKVYVVAANAVVQTAMQNAGLWEETIPLETYDLDKIG